jgi:hypothetical protein
VLKERKRKAVKSRRQRGKVARSGIGPETNEAIVKKHLVTCSADSTGTRREKGRGCV